MIVFHILLIEDDKEINFILTEFLKRNQYNITSLSNGITAIESLSLNSHTYDLILLDLMLPDISGEKILDYIKQKKLSIPVIVISAKTNPEQRIQLLRSGADDYITKPFYYEEVLARIETVLRRCSLQKQEHYQYKDIILYVNSRLITVNQQTLSLTNTEYQLLELFLTYPKRIFTKGFLYERIWDKEYFVDDNTLHVHISNLRKKIEQYGTNSPYIDTIRGIGYRLHS